MSEIFFKEGIKQHAKMNYCEARRGDTYINEPNGNIVDIT